MGDRELGPSRLELNQFQPGSVKDDVLWINQIRAEDTHGESSASLQNAWHQGTDSRSRIERTRKCEEENRDKHVGWTSLSVHPSWLDAQARDWRDRRLVFDSSQWTDKDVHPTEDCIGNFNCFSMHDNSIAT